MEDEDSPLRYTTPWFRLRFRRFLGELLCHFGYDERRPEIENRNETFTIMFSNVSTPGVTIENPDGAAMLQHRSVKQSPSNDDISSASIVVEQHDDDETQHGNKPRVIPPTHWFDLFVSILIVTVASVEYVTTAASGWPLLTCSAMLKIAVVPLCAVSIIAVQRVESRAFCIFIGMAVIAICSVSIGESFRVSRGARSYLSVGSCLVYMLSGYYAFVRAVLAVAYRASYIFRGPEHWISISWAFVHAAIIFICAATTIAWPARDAPRIAFVAAHAISFFLPLVEVTLWGRNECHPKRKWWMWTCFAVAACSFVGQIATGIVWRLVAGKISALVEERTIFATVRTYSIVAASAAACLPHVAMPFCVRLGKWKRFVVFVSGNQTSAVS
jgi:hypothetical protein